MQKELLFEALEGADAAIITLEEIPGEGKITCYRSESHIFLRAEEDPTADYNKMQTLADTMLTLCGNIVRSLAEETPERRDALIDGARGAFSKGLRTA